MKTLFLKNMLPAGVIALALAGAFATTSMQSASKSSVSYRQGFNALSNGKCGDIPVDCDDDSSKPFCHVSGGTTGPLAYDNVSNNCIMPLYKPD